MVAAGALVSHPKGNLGEDSPCAGNIDPAGTRKRGGQIRQRLDIRVQPDPDLVYFLVAVQSHSGYQKGVPGHLHAAVSEGVAIIRQCPVGALGVFISLPDECFFLDEKIGKSGGGSVTPGQGDVAPDFRGSVVKNIQFANGGPNSAWPGNSLPRISARFPCESW